MAQKQTPLYDVVIFEKDTRRVDAVVGKALAYDTGFYNAQRRLATAYSRINEAYSAAIVSAGKYEKGSFLTAKDAR